MTISDGTSYRYENAASETRSSGSTTARTHRSAQAPNRLRKNHFGTAELRWPTRFEQEESYPQDAQKDRPARPQQAKRRGVRFGTLSL